MGKPRALYFILAAVLLLTSCAPNVPGETTQPQVSEQTTLPETETTMPQTTAATETANPLSYLMDIEPIIWEARQTEYLMFSVWSQEAYDDYFSGLEIRPEMIYYKEISDFGAFDGYVGYFPRGSCTYDRYFYAIRGADNYRFSFDVYHHEVEPLSDQGYVQLDFAECRDLRRSPIENLPAPARLEYEGFTYRYSKGGRLLSINWVENGIQFKITGPSSLEDYPVETDTLLGKLLSTETFREAAETIRNMKLTEGLPCGMVGKDSAAYPAGYWEMISGLNNTQLEEIKALSHGYDTLEFLRLPMISFGVLDQNTPRLTLEQAKAIIAELREEYTQNGVRSFAAICPTFLARFNEIAGAPDIRDAMDENGDWVTYVYILDETTGEKICVREDGNVIHMKDGESKTLFAHRKYMEKSST